MKGEVQTQKCKQCQLTPLSGFRESRVPAKEAVKWGHGGHLRINDTISVRFRVLFFDGEPEPLVLWPLPLAFLVQVPVQFDAVMSHFAHDWRVRL